MIVCLCHVVSDREIRQLAENGAQSVRDIQRVTQAGQTCGCCLSTIAEELDAHRGRAAQNLANTPSLVPDAV